MKLTRHNGRSGKHGTYNPKHNDRTFDVSNSEHIDEERAKHNVYWDCFNGYRTFAEKQVQSELADTFEEVEELFYSAKYGAYVEAQNARNDKNRHSERNRTTTDLLKDKRTCPEETIYQIGKMGDHVSPDVLLKVVTDFFVEMERRFGSHVHILDWALHLDEATPHIQERHVFDCENRYGEICPQQEKALEALGFELPDPTKKQGRHNNRKMTFDSACRAMLFDIAKRHGLHLEQEPEYGGRAYLDSYTGNAVCSKQLYREALGHEYDEPKQWELREINDIMNNVVKGWKSFSNPRHFPKPYLRQKGWERELPDNGEADNGDGRFIPLSDAELEQMELPEGWR
ncbi:plasmid recombination protein [Intestinibacillus sp. Marseille-P6563]|uniref:plasmid recombination protein n=1 Tax=Intestinibacillus sp. Marseille-P6563 TaxID=2364792 RepID=UPI001FAB042C|nr:plasmid recombination protein [Intestinibacillus sp. Marseille-P6563]